MPSTDCFRFASLPVPVAHARPFPAKRWVKVLEWTGHTMQSLLHRVAVSPPTAVVKWRRTSSGQVSEGSANGGMHVEICPADTNLALELWVDEPSVTISLEPVGAALI
jgi:hypothetical protein